MSQILSSNQFCFVYEPIHFHTMKSYLIAKMGTEWIMGFSTHLIKIMSYLSTKHTFETTIKNHFYKIGNVFLKHGFKSVYL